MTSTPPSDEPDDVDDVDNDNDNVANDNADSDDSDDAPVAPVDVADAARVGHDVDDDRAVLIERARLLARPLAATAARRDRRTAMILVTGGERFAIDLDACLGVMTAPAVSALPLAPPRLAGVVLVRGKVVACFVLTADDAGDRAADEAGERAGDGPRVRRKLVLLGRREVEIGLLVEDASDVVLYDDDDVLPLALERADDGLPLLGLLPGGVPLLDGRALADDPRFSFAVTPTTSRAQS